MQGQIFLQITHEEFRQLVRESVAEAVKPLLSTFRKPAETKYYTRQETSQKLGVSLATLWAYDRAGILTASRVGSRVLYREVDIEKALQGGQIKVA